MPSEPDKNIDRLLKGYAKQRRDQAGEPFELHAATRNVLQAEVARRGLRAGARPPNWIALLAAHWPRFAIAGGLTALLFVGLVFWSDSQAKRKLPRPYDVAKLTQERTEQASSAQDLARSLGERNPVSLGVPTAPPAAREDQTEKSPGSVQESRELAKATLTSGATETDFANPGPVQRYGLLPSGDSVKEKLASTDSDARLALAGTTLADSPAPDPARNGQEVEQLSRSVSRGGEGKVTLSAEAGRVTPAPRPLEISPALASGPESLRIQPTTGRDALNEAPSGGQSPQPYHSYAKAATLGKAEGVNSLTADPKALFHAPLQQQVAARAQSVPTIQNQVQNLDYFSNTSSRQRFVQTQTGKSQKAKTPKLPAILTSFEVEQSGNTIRITEPDGSTYGGELRAAGKPGAAPETASNSDHVAAKELPSLSRTRDLADSKPVAVVSAGYELQNIAFRAVGTSRTLQQPIVLNGTIMLDTNESSYADFLARNVSGAPAQALGVQGNVRQNVPFPATRIEAEALVGASQQLEILAEPAGR